MNKLNCECNHIRKEHESGKEKLSDSSVSKCMIKDCPCNEYHANYETRKLIWKIRFKAIFWSGLIIVGCIVAGWAGTAMINASVDYTTDQYVITPKFHIMNKWQNGTLTNSTNYYDNESFKEVLGDAAWLPMFIVLAVAAMAGSMFTYFSITENEYKRLIHE